jgi:hypothetical protein
MLSGDPETRDKPKPKYPDWMTVTNYLRSREEPQRDNPLPRYVGINPPLEYNGPAYLGDMYSPFTVSGDPSNPNFTVPNIGLSDSDEVQRLGRRSDLRQKLDTLTRAFDRAGELGALDQFESQAISLLTSPKTKEAFDLTKEDDRTRDRYGRNAWGQQLLMARRLVEAGVEILTTSLSGPLCGRVGNWDDHAVNHHVFDALRFRAEIYDQAVTALVEDLYARGLDRRVLLVVTGEFGRTPRLENQLGTQTKVHQPGRDHWPGAQSILVSGGGLRMGQVVGSTDARGGYPKDRPLSPNDVWATVYRHLGIDPELAVPDLGGRPMPILPFGEPIRELLG